MCNGCNGNHEVEVLKDGIIEVKEEYTVVRVDGKIKIQIDRVIPEFDESRIIDKETALLKVRPELWNEWYFEKNDELGLDIYEMTKGKHNKVWWVCPDCGSPYDMPINSRTGQNQKCSFCRGLRINESNSLVYVRPNLAKQWHPKKNGDLTPYDVSYRYTKKAWFICVNCGSEYGCSLVNVTKDNNGCEYCAGHAVNETNSLASLRPDIASQWDYSKNGELTPNDVTWCSGRKVWWICEKGHSYDTTIANRNNGTGCPYCSGKYIWIGFNDMWTTNPDLSKLLADPNDGYKYMQNSHQKLDWQCPSCGELIKNKAISDINRRGISCPNCSDGISYPEKFMYHLLKQLEVGFEYQKRFKWSDNKRFDFFIEYR